MKVGYLKELLASLPDDLEVALEDSNFGGPYPHFKPDFNRTKTHFLISFPTDVEAVD